MMAGVDLVQVHYRSSGPALTDLISGQVQATFDPLPASIEFIRAGKLRPLGVTTAMRLEALPGIPSVSEYVPGYEASGYQGIGAPKDTRPDAPDWPSLRVAAGRQSTLQRKSALFDQRSHTPFSAHSIGALAP